jgi:hypothetical protein
MTNGSSGSCTAIIEVVKTPLAFLVLGFFNHRRIASAPAQCDAFLRHAVFRVTGAVSPGGPDAHR